MYDTGPAWRRLLDHLADGGPSEPVDLQDELELKGRELKALRERGNGLPASAGTTWAVTQTGVTA